MDHWRKHPEHRTIKHFEMNWKKVNKRTINLNMSIMWDILAEFSWQLTTLKLTTFRGNPRPSKLQDETTIYATTINIFYSVFAFSTSVIFQPKITILIYLNTWCQAHYFAAQRYNLITDFGVNKKGKKCRFLLHTKSTNISKVQWHIKKWNWHDYISQEINLILMKIPLHCTNLLHSQFLQILKTDNVISLKIISRGK
jgi:hypothetical protein